MRPDVENIVLIQDSYQAPLNPDELTKPGTRTRWLVGGTVLWLEQVYDEVLLAQALDNLVYMRVARLALHGRLEA